MSKFKFEAQVFTQVEIEADSVEEARRKFLSSEFSDVFDIGGQKGDIIMAEGSAELTSEPGMKPMPFEINGNSVHDVILNLADVAYELGCAFDDEGEIAKAIYKGTDCGCVFDCDTKGITVAGYAEGADAECPSHRLDYPFSPHDFWTTLEEADAEGVQMWHEWNDEEEDA